MNKHILVSALDWGYGHVTRTNIRVNQFLKLGHDVTIACSKNQFQLWSDLQPNLHIIPELPDNEIELKGLPNEMLHLATRRKSFRKNWQIEFEWVQKFAQNNIVDQIFSDNRYGFYSTSIESTLLTHQLNLQGPWPWNFIAQLGLNKQLRNFKNIEIPDYPENPKLSGKLSNTSRKNIVFIGPLAPVLSKNTTNTNPFEHVLYLSGPEPQRSNFAKQIIDLWPSHLNLTVIGECNLKYTHLNISIIGFLNTNEKLQALNEAKLIITRSGYSTLMELHALHKKALLVPTKGQWEQEYLGKYWESQFGFPCIQQQALSTKCLLSLIETKT